MNVSELRVLLRVSDFEASARFYQDVLGLACQRRWENPKGHGMILRAGGNGFIELVGPRAEPPTRRVELWLRVDDVADAYERVQSQGAAIARELADDPWGTRSFGLDDPDGTRVWLFEETGTG